MSRVELTIDIGASPAAVWALITDLDRLGEWVTIHRGLDRADHGPLREGFTMQQTLELRGQDFTVDWVAAVVEPEDVLRWEGNGPAGSQAVSEYHLEGAGALTRFTYLNDFDPPGGLVGRVASTIVMGAVPEEEATASLQRLKALLEVEPA